MRRFMFLVVAVITLFAPASTAASTPDMGTFDSGFVSFVDDEVCADEPWGFDVTATEHEYGFYQVVGDEHGHTRINVHFNYEAWISANGRTIVERNTWTLFLDGTTAREVGLTVHIQGTGGIVQRDAGQIVADADGNLLFVRGPHDQFSGGSFCPALAG